MSTLTYLNPVGRIPPMLAHREIPFVQLCLPIYPELQLLSLLWYQSAATQVVPPALASPRPLAKLTPDQVSSVAHCEGHWKGCTPDHRQLCCFDVHTVWNTKCITAAVSKQPLWILCMLEKREGWQHLNHRTGTVEGRAGASFLCTFCC